MPYLKSLPLLSLFLTSIAIANSDHHSHGSSASSHAPLGVMGDHMHAKGEWMVSYRRMTMNMEGNIHGSRRVSAEQVVSSLANPFNGPANVRVVPLKMTTQMDMVGLMFAPTDNVTLMLMLNHVTKEMDHVTFQGMVGTNVLGNFTTKTSGLGDTKFGALVGLYESTNHKIHANLGISIPTGSIDQDGRVLAPTNMMPVLRLPYAMQLGSGTYDLEPGITYVGNHGNINWGGQVKLVSRLGENDENYTLGDKQEVTTWAQYSFSQSLSVSSRILFSTSSDIDGQDLNIAAPVQTANPDNYGGDRLDLALGVNLLGQNGWLNGHRLALEYQTTVSQDANGTQMEMDDMLTVGYQYAF